MPFANFQQIRSADDLFEFFGAHFPDSIELIGRTRLTTDFFNAKPQYLVSVKVCIPSLPDNIIIILSEEFPII